MNTDDVLLEQSIEQNQKRIIWAIDNGYKSVKRIRHELNDVSPGDFAVAWAGLEETGHIVKRNGVWKVAN
jgi:hypothetical protein